MNQIKATSKKKKKKETVEQSAYGGTSRTFFGSNEEVGIALGRCEIGSGSRLRIPEELILFPLQLIGPLEPLLVLANVEKVQQTADGEGVIIQKPFDRHRAATINHHH